jgi:triosephosphate isomerase
MAVAPQYIDIPLIVNNTSIPVFAQHVDAEIPGSYTGYVTPESIKEAGACGSIINHSEHRLRTDVIEDTIKRCKSIGLLTCVCANTATIGKALAALNPEIIAVEPPELIGGNISVSKAKPEVIIDSVRMIKSVNSRLHSLCGAGIKTGEDVAMALKLGSEGILVASGVVKAKYPESVLREFAKYAKQ